MLFSEQWRLRLIAMLGVSAAGAACATPPPPDPQEPVPTSTVPEPEPDSTLATNTSAGLCGPDEMREIQCGVGVKEGAATAPEPHTRCPANSDDLTGFGFSNMLRFDRIAERHLPFDAQRTNKYAEDASKHSGGESCCFSRCVALDTTPQNTPVPRGFELRTRCFEALESPSRNPSPEEAHCPAGVMMQDPSTPPFYARFTRTTRGNVVGQLDKTMCCYQGLKRRRSRPYRGRALNGPAGPLLAAHVDSGQWLGAQPPELAAEANGQTDGHDNALHAYAQSLAMPADPALREVLRARWLADAAEEHASVAAFSKLSLDLLGLGAPPALLADSHQAALDEIAHAQLSYALASAYAGTPLGPGPLATQLATTGSAAELAEETFRDGCVGETVATLCALRAAEQTDCPQLQAIFRRIAADEQRHAELAWRVVRWLVHNNAEARNRIETACAELLRDAHAHRPESPNAQDAALSSYGMLSAADEHAAHLEALDHIVAPCLDTLLGAVALRHRGGARARGNLGRG